MIDDELSSFGALYLGAELPDVLRGSSDSFLSASQETPTHC